MRSYQRLNRKADEENSLKKALEDWCQANLTQETIDRNCVEDQDAEDSQTEGIYFLRTGYMKEQIQKKFLNLDEDLLDHFVDTYYTELYGEQ